MPKSAGWWPDPTGAAPSRYWDGGEWTEHVANAQGEQWTDDYDETRKPPRPWARLSGAQRVWVGAAAFILVAIVVVIATQSGSGGPTRAEVRDGVYQACYLSTVGDYSPFDLVEDPDATVTSTGPGDFNVSLGDGFECIVHHSADKYTVLNHTP